MLNRNFKTVMLGWIMDSRERGTNDPIFNQKTIYKVEGGVGTAYPPINDQYAGHAIINALNALSTDNALSNQGKNRLFMAIGTGTTAATEEDYTLEDVNTAAVCESITQTYTSSYKRQVTATFSNPTNQEISLKEVGLFFETFKNSEVNITMMLSRENIDVTIPAGESKAITIEIG